MRASLCLLAAVSLAACRTSSLGACADDTQCPTGATCDVARKLCTVAAGVCFPLCDASHACDSTTVTCVAVQVPEVTISSPAAGTAVTGSTLQAAATARAPGGVSAVRFELHDASGALLGAADGTQGADPAAWTATIDVSAVPGGPASLVASGSWAQGTVTSAEVAISIVDTDAPQIAAITYTPAGFTDTGGHLVFGAGGPISVQATLTDRSGIDPASVCLRISGETGACAHPGTAGAGGVYTFLLPRPAAPQDGTAPLSFTLEASDTLANHASVAQTAYFDYAGPTVAVTPDATVHARSGPPIAVSALVTGALDIPDGGVFLNGTLAPSARDGGLFTFQLDPASAPAGAEGPFAVQVSATDAIGNTAQGSGSVLIDDKPPTLTNLRVFEGTDPGTAGLSYPAAVLNTGWNGGSLIYSDTVHVKGHLADVAGIASARLHVDGTDINGGVALGTNTDLGCAASATSCDFEVLVKLNEADGGNVQFHTGSTAADGGVSGLQLPFGTLTFTIDTQDALAHGGTSATPATVTRLLWQQAVTSGNVTGLAVHPSGDLIVTSNAVAADPVYDLAPDHASIRWHAGSGFTPAMFPVSDQPAIGEGDGGTALIYVADTQGNLFALNPDGSKAWINATAASFAVAPAVDNALWTDGGTGEQILVPDSAPGSKKLWAVASASVSNPVNTSDIDTFSSPMVFSNAVWFGTGVGTAGHVTRHLLQSTGIPSPFANLAGAPGRPYWGFTTDGTSVFAGTHRNPGSTSNLSLLSVSTAFAITWNTTSAHMTAEPTLGIDGQLYASHWVGTQTGTLGSQTESTTTVDPSSGTFLSPPLVPVGQSSTTVAGPVGLVPLHGSDGNWYLPVNTGSVGAYQGAKLSWQFVAPATLLRTTTMDCSGRLFVAAGNTVYALVSDDHGLGDTAWPALRRDARNTGNTKAPKFGIRTTGNACLQ